MPGTRRDRELSDETIGTMPRDFVPFARNAGVAESLDIGTEVWPGVLSSNELEGTVLTGMACRDVVVFELQDSGSYVAGF